MNSESNNNTGLNTKNNDNIKKEENSDNNQLEDFGTITKTHTCENKDCTGNDCKNIEKEIHYPGYDAKEKLAEHHGKGEGYETYSKLYEKVSYSKNSQ